MQNLIFHLYYLIFSLNFILIIKLQFIYFYASNINYPNFLNSLNY